MTPLQEMPRWQNGQNGQNGMYGEVSNDNRQNFNSQNYADWGSAPFNESRRLPPRGKAQHHHHSKRGHHQANWSSERGPAVSPQWQPQPPPPPPPPPPSTPPSQNYSGFTEPQGGPVAVNLSGLPPALCRQNFLEAMLDQAGLENEIMGCVLGDAQETGKAVIYLASFNAALKCVQHFGGRRWANTGPPVMAQVAEGQTGKASPEVGGEGQISKDTNSKQEQMNMPSPMPSPVLEFAAGPGAWAMPQPMLPLMAVGGYHKGSDLVQMNAGTYSPTSTGSGSNSPKTRWADIDDVRKEDLSEGLDCSTSCDSTGCTGLNRDESFSFGCDVDTDDGF